MNILYTLTSILFFVWTIRNIFFWISLWQIKEYRFDRLRTHFKETTKGKSVLTSKFLLLKWFVIFSYIFFAIDETNLLLFQITVFLVFLIEAFKVSKEFFNHTLKRPVPTVKTFLLIILLFLTTILLYFSPLVTEKFLWLLLVERFIPVATSIFVIFLALPTDFFQTLTIEKAIKKIKRHENVLVIGVSGSYGKSSTKEYIAQLLSEKFQVLKTEGSHNTPIGIAYTILKGLKENTGIFVVELGSYKKGEIAELCNIVHPKISVTTSISDQHLSLFGSYENIFATEKELIDSLPKVGVALFNANNTNTYSLYKQTHVKKILYECIDKNTMNKSSLRRKNSSDIIAYDVIMKQKSVQFTVSFKGKEYHYEAPLLGVHAVENILPAIYLGHYLGMTYKDMKAAVLRLKPLARRMISHELLSRGVVIDDTFNASPESIEAALTYMSLYKGKRVLVLEPMIELGKNASNDHFELGKKIAKVCDYLFLTNKNYFRSIIKGVSESENMCEVEVAAIKEIVEFVNKTVSKNDIVVFEGRESAAALNKIV